MASTSNLQQQVIGAAVQDAKVQAAVREAARDPRVQQAAYNAAADTAKAAARQSAQNARAELVEVRTYIQQNHCSLKILCFCIAIALFVSSILGMINIFNAVFKPHQYLWAFYNLLFAAAIIIMDGKPQWFERCCDLQTKLYSAAPVLASQTGRGMFYLYVGSINVVMLPDNWFWKMAYFGIGVSLAVAGILMLVHRCGCGGSQHRSLEECQRESA